MIKSIKVTNYRNESLTLELANPYKTGLAVTSVDGLGPAEASISTSDIASKDGSLFNSARLGNRNIVLNLRLLPDPKIDAISDVEKIRHTVYRYFPIKKKITLEITTNDRIGKTVGYVEKCEPNIFTKNQTIQISIICPDPWLRSTEEIKVNSLEVEDVFSFPLESIMTERKNLLDLSDCENFIMVNKISVTFEKNDDGMVNKVILTALEDIVAGTSYDENIIFSIPENVSGVLTLENNAESYLPSKLEYGILIEERGAAYQIIPYDVSKSQQASVYTYNGINTRIKLSFYDLEMSKDETIELYPMIRKRTDTDLTFEPYMSTDKIYDSAKYLHFGYIEASNRIEISNEGDSDTGILINAEFIDTVTNLTFEVDGNIFSLNDEVISSITSNGSFAKGDFLKIDSRKGSKQVILTRGDIKYNIIGALTSESSWITIEPGTSVLNLSADENDESSIYNAFITLDMDKLYEGV